MARFVNFKGNWRVKDDCYPKLCAVIDHLAATPLVFRYPNNFKVGSEWWDKKNFTYYCEKLVKAGLAERKVVRKGCYAWALYRLIQNKEKTYEAMGEIPF